MILSLTNAQMIYLYYLSISTYTLKLFEDCDSVFLNFFFFIIKKKKIVMQFSCSFFSVRLKMCILQSGFKKTWLMKELLFNFTLCQAVSMSFFKSFIFNIFIRVLHSYIAFVFSNQIAQFYL